MGRAAATGGWPGVASGLDHLLDESSDAGCNLRAIQQWGGLRRRKKNGATCRLNMGLTTFEWLMYCLPPKVSLDHLA
jgi:hypothetical protein